MLGKRAILAGVAFSLTAALAMAVSSGHNARAGTGLIRGWNNVSYQGSAKPPAEALASIAGQYSAVYRWNAATQGYEMFGPGVPAYAATLTQLSPGDAIWLNVTTESAQLGTTSTRRISVAASTFLPTNDLAIYEKTFNQLSPVGSDAASVRYYAPVTLPDGATVTSMTAAFEATGGTVQVRLDYTPIVNGTEVSQIYKLVEVLSSAGASPLTAQAFAHVVDNNANVYFLVVDLTGGSGTKLRGVTIAFTGG